jgi:hypothetical protein
MAIYCGVCATRICSAPENGGSFRTGPDFRGWDIVRLGHPTSRINDTCEACAERLKTAITEEAMRIARANQARVDAMRESVEEEIRTRNEREARRRAFEAEWVERELKRGRT